MLSAIAFIVAFFIFTLTIIPGIIMFLMTMKKLKKNGIERRSMWKTWLTGTILTGTIWALIIKMTIQFDSSGAPTEEDWINLYQLFAMGAALPGISLFFAGIFQRIWLRIEIHRGKHVQNP